MAASGVPEYHLVREVLHACQGIDGKYVYYQEDGAPKTSSGHFGCAPDADISFTQQQLISKITELGWLLRKVKELTVIRERSLRSVVQEALVAAALKELNNYYRLIAILEAQAQKLGAATTSSQQDGGGGKGQLSLRRLVVWLSEPLQRLRVLAACLEAAIPLRGGEAINALHSLSKHGDPLVRRVVAPLVDGACIPYFRYIVRWVLDGSIENGLDEFMIVPQYIGADADTPSRFWREGYVVNKDMQPRFISDELATRILTAGKTVAFLRDVCADADWSEVVTPSAMDLETNAGSYRQLRWLDAAVSEVASSVGRRLVEVMLEREKLLSHLSAIKRYVLMGQGDFVRTLLDLAGSDLDKPAREVSIYALHGHLEAALRSCCSATDDTDLLKHVEVRLQRVMEGDKGWDVFGVSYNIEGPAAAVLGPETMASYARASRLLWSITHVDHVLAQTWHKLNSAAHGMSTLSALEKEHGVDVAAAHQLPAVLRYLHARRAEMAQFVTGLQHHIVFEVVEPAWARMLKQLPKADGLDDIIALHEGALAEIAKGMFLDGPRSQPSLSTTSGLTGSSATTSTASASSNVHAALRATLRSLLDIMGPIRRLADAVDQAVTEQYAYLQRVKDSEKSGTWSDEVYNSPTGVSEDLLTEVRSGAWRVHNAFERHMRTFASLLPSQSVVEQWGFLPQLEKDGSGDISAVASLAGVHKYRSGFT